MAAGGMSWYDETYVPYPTLKESLSVSLTEMICERVRAQGGKLANEWKVVGEGSDRGGRRKEEDEGDESFVPSVAMGLTLHEIGTGLFSLPEMISQLEQEHPETLRQQATKRAEAASSFSSPLAPPSPPTPLHLDFLSRFCSLRWKKESVMSGREPSHFIRRCYQCSLKHSVSFSAALERQVCDDCDALNRSKREKYVDLAGKFAVVTGGRTKIGYHCALKLLRCGARVVVTTRFPNIAYKRFLGEEDSGEWGERLVVYGLDMRVLGAVMGFIDKVVQKYGYPDILINNAAQTIHRPPGYYREMVEEEERLEREWFDEEEGVKEGEGEGERQGKRPEFKPQVFRISSAGSILDSAVALPPPTPSSPSSFSSPSSSPPHSPSSSSSYSYLSTPLFPAALPPSSLTQLALIPEDRSTPQEIEQNFPLGKRDAHSEPLDLRNSTSWTRPIGQIHPYEIFFVQLVNNVVPTLLVSHLMPNVTGVGARGLCRFVVNVSSQEGSFSVKKTGAHTHTNMAKAALNMMTKSMGNELRGDNVYITSVDTGWVSLMTPGQRGRKGGWWGGVLNAPLTESDGAARVLDPVLTGYEAFWRKDLNSIQSGVFLKNFEIIPW
uniref:Protochlorophyllide reductase n=1 Tax=Paramoeba aestuarina TaxID=180227 RepID=A0A7S4PHK6_9EUKA